MMGEYSSTGLRLPSFCSSRLRLEILLPSLSVMITSSRKKAAPAGSWGESSLRRICTCVMSAFWASVRAPRKGLPWNAWPRVRALKALT